jgi:hypothetical protein
MSIPDNGDLRRALSKPPLPLDADAPRTEPWPDRTTAADRDRIRAEYAEAAAARRAMLARQAPWWMRALARLPNPKQPLEDWIAAAKAKLRNRL